MSDDLQGLSTDFDVDWGKRPDYDENNPAVQIRRALAEAKQHGRGFGPAWEVALSQVEWRGTAEEQRTWKAVLRDTRADWQANYEGADSRATYAAALLLHRE